MKSLTAIFAVLIILSLVFSLTALLIVTQNNNSLTPNPPTPTSTITPEYTPPTITETPQPTPTPSFKTNITLTCTEKNREENNGQTKVTLTIDLTYNSGNTITIDYSEFCLGLYVGRFIYNIGVGTAEPQNSGSFTLGPAHSTHTFQLTFEEFPTETHNGMDGYRSTHYQLEYSGRAVIQWTNPRAY